MGFAKRYHTRTVHTFTSFVLGFVEIEDAALEKHFLDCGSIVAVRILRNPLTGVGRGFGYVLFEVRGPERALLLLGMKACAPGRSSVLCRDSNSQLLTQESSIHNHHNRMPWLQLSKHPCLCMLAVLYNTLDAGC